MIGQLKQLSGRRMYPLLAAVLSIGAGSVDAISENASHRPAISTYQTGHDADQGAVVLRREQVITVQESGLSEQRTYMAIRLNDDTAVQDYSQMEIRHNSYTSDVTIAFARVFNGEEVKYLSEDAITRQNMSSESYLFDNERLLFSLPTLRKGAVIELEYTTKSKKAVTPGQFTAQMNHYWWENRANNTDARLDPVLDSILSITYPTTMGMSHVQSPVIGSKPALTEKSGLSTLAWHSRNLPEIKPEDWMPEDIALYPFVLVSSFDSWKDINTWSQQLFEQHVSQHASVLDIARQIEQTAGTEPEKIKAVFDYMEDNIRYVYAHVGRNGYEPHDAQDVLSNGYGDCKDQTVLSVSILRAMGIQAYPALTAIQGSALSRGMPRNYFDHMLVYIPPTQDRSAIWLDTTGSMLDFPGVHLSYEGKPALVVNGQDDQLTPIMPDANTRHAVLVELSFQPVSGGNVELHVDITYAGLMGQNIASALHFASDKDAFIKEMLRPLYPQTTLSSASHHKVADSKETYVLSAVFISKDGWKGAPSPFNVGSGIAQFTNLVYSLASIEEPGKRTQPLQTPKPFELSLVITIPQPADKYAPLVVTKGSDYTSKYFDIKQSSRIDDNNGFVIEALFTSKEVVIPLDEYENFYRATRNLQEMPNWLVSYQYDEKSSELSKLTLETDSVDVGEILKRAEIFLSNGKFSEALILADKAATLEASNAKAHYLKGVALGYQQQFDESNQAFAKAMELGYEL